MINAQQARDRNVRQGVSDNILKLVNRAQGLDILLYAEQDQVSNKLIRLEDAQGNVADIINEGFTLFKIDHLGAHFERLDDINYPVPPCEAAIVHRDHVGASLR